MDSTQAVAQLEQAHSEAIMRTMETGEPEPVLITPLAAAFILEYIADLQERNATLGRRYAAEAEAVARVSFLAGELSQESGAAERNASTRIMEAITQNP